MASTAWITSNGQLNRKNLFRSYQWQTPTSDYIQFALGLALTESELPSPNQQSWERCIHHMCRHSAGEWQSRHTVKASQNQVRPTARNRMGISVQLFVQKYAPGPQHDSLFMAAPKTHRGHNLESCRALLSSSQNCSLPTSWLILSTT